MASGGGSGGGKLLGRSIKGRCLVTGGSGFVGQRLVEMLVDRGASRVVGKILS
jgi:nucleoside-diphosphate-sugar epimerase